MPKWLKAGLWIIGIIVYLNVGYLVFYSMDGAAQQTVVTEKIYGVMDFMGAVERMAVEKFPEYIDVVVYYVMSSIFWPVVVLVIWATNSLVLLWKVGVWLVTGGFFKWLGLVKV